MATTYRGPLQQTDGAGNIHQVIDPRFGTGATPTKPSGWASDGGSTSLPFTVVTASGDTTGATDKAAIQNAVNAANAAGGGEVIIDGQHYTNGTITLKTGVWLRGLGPDRSSIHLTSGANVDVVTSDPLGWRYGIANLSIDGHRENNSSGRGVFFTYTGSVDSGPLKWNATCTNVIVSNVDVRYTADHGIEMTGCVEGRIEGCFVLGAGGYGYRIDGSDQWLVDSRSGESAKHGIYVQGLGHRLYGCKSWWSGRTRSASARDTLVPFSNGGDGSASNFYITGSNHEVAICESQDASGHGWKFISCDSCKVSAKSDADGAFNKTFGVCFAMQNCTDSSFSLSIGQGSSHPWPDGSGVVKTAYAIQLDNTMTGNRVDVTGRNYVTAQGGNSTTVSSNIISFAKV